jgi:glycosyltransferase involved in cell wall biosynthesis
MKRDSNVLVPASPGSDTARRASSWPTVKPVTARRIHIALVMKRIVGRAGGGEKVLCETANMLADAGAKVILYHGDPPGMPFFPLRPSVDVVSVRPLSKNVPNTYAAPKGKPRGAEMLKFRFPISMGLWLWQHGWHVQALSRFIRAHRPDIVIAFQPSATTDTLLATVGTEIPVVASLHNVPEQDFHRWERWDANPFDRLLRRLMLHRARRVTVLLEEFVRQLPKSIQRRAVVIPNCVQAEGRPADVRTTPDGPNTVIAVGRLAAAKDHACLIDAWAKLHHRYPDWQVEIYGNGPLRKALQQRIVERGVRHSFHLRGETDRVMDAYARSKIFCMPSLFEGFGLVTAEALVKGLPAVGFVDCPGTNTLIEHERNGLLAEPGKFGGDRAAALADALARLIEDEALRSRLAAAAPESMSRFSPPAIRDRWIALVNEIVPEPLHLR